MSWGGGVFWGGLLLNCGPETCTYPVLLMFQNAVAMLTDQRAAYVTKEQDNAHASYWCKEFSATHACLVPTISVLRIL